MTVACVVCGRIVERVDAHERHDVDCPNFLLVLDGGDPVECECPYDLTCDTCCVVCNPEENHG